MQSTEVGRFQGALGFFRMVSPMYNDVQDKGSQFPKKKRICLHLLCCY